MGQYHPSHISKYMYVTIWKQALELCKQIETYTVKNDGDLVALHDEHLHRI